MHQLVNKIFDRCSVLSTRYVNMKDVASTCFSTSVPIFRERNMQSLNLVVNDKLLSTNVYTTNGGTRWRGWFKYCAKSPKGRGFIS